MIISVKGGIHYAMIDVTTRVTVHLHGKAKTRHGLYCYDTGAMNVTKTELRNVLAVLTNQWT